ncbi:MAG: hypothetical protein AB1513_11930 [Pseudomonadota bacterium]
MKFPAEWPPPVTGVTSPTDVREPGVVNPVRPAADALNAPRQRYRPVAPRPEGNPPFPQVAEEAPPRPEARQGEDRRSEDRRKVQVPVILNTRVGQDRRRQSRRDEDEPPTGISVKV